MIELFHRRGLRRILGAGLTIAGLVSGGGLARAGDEPDPRTGVREQSIAKSLPTLAVDADLRAALAKKGLFYQINYNTDFLANTRGGLKRGATFSGRLEFGVDADLEKLVGWSGATAHFHLFHIQGAGLSRNYVGNLMPVSNIEAIPKMRLFEAWIEQNFGDNFSIRLGQLGVDSEHASSATASLFNNGTFGWPAILGANLPSGGPAYPLATPGVRAKYLFDKNTSWLVALFNGDPAPAGPGDAQVRNPHGLDFRLRHGAYLVTEAQHKYNQGKDAAGLSGGVRFGLWRHFANFNDMRQSTDGRSLADPSSNGVARRHRGDYGVYGMIDQMIWKLPGSEDKGVNVFARAFANPSDRNLIGWQFDTGVVASGLIAARPDDLFGVALSYARFSDGARGLDADAIRYGTGRLRRDYEAIVEANYQWQVMPGWTLQPNVQYVFPPGGRIADPADPTGRTPIRNALVVGLRSGWRW